MSYHYCKQVGPRYFWDTIPPHLKTQAMLRKVGRKPAKDAQPVAYVQGGHGAYDLFNEADTVAVQTVTAKQKEVLARARRLKHHPQECEETGARVAAAFGVDKWRNYKPDKEHSVVYCTSEWQGFIVAWTLGLGIEDECFPRLMRSGELVELRMEKHHPTTWPEPSLRVSLCDRRGYASESVTSQMRQKMAEVVFLLGIEDEQVIEQVNYHLSMTDKAELRLTFSREFWPPKWIEEERDENQPH